MRGTLLLKGGMIYTVNERDECFEKGDLLIKDGEISAIGKSGTLDLPPEKEMTVRNCEGYLLIPGLVNAHSHSQSALTKMMRSGDRTNTITALWYGFAHNEGRTPEDVALSAKVNAVQMIKSGCTCTIDQFNFGGNPAPENIDAVVQGYAEAGMRALVTFDMTDREQKNIIPKDTGGIPESAFRVLKNKAAVTVQELTDRFNQAAAKHQRSNGGKILLVPGTPIPNICSDELLKTIARLAAEQDTIYTCHMLEHYKERKTTAEIWDEPEIEHLTNLGYLSPRLNIAHCIWITDEEIERLSKTGASVTHCPELNIKLGGGVAKIRKMLNAGINVALGADSATNQVVFDIMKLTALVHRVGKLNPQEWIYANEILRMATIGGARALGLGDKVGSLEVGKRADICLLDLSSPWLCPTTDLTCRLVYTETGASVKTVLIDGDVVMEDGVLQTIPERETMQAAQKASDRLYEANLDYYELADAMTKLLDPEIKSLADEMQMI